MMLSAVPFEKLGFKTHIQEEPLPALTWNVLSKIPGVVSVGGTMLAGIWWITSRRDEVAREEGKHVRVNKAHVPARED
jgi:formate dehydrogenase iron-sulfur subunit